MPQVPQTESGTTDNSQQNDLTLPDDLAQSLNQLNIIQEQYNQANLDIESLQRRLYSQWYIYMKDDPNFYGDVNDYSLVPLRTAMATAGEIEFSGQGTSTIVTAKTLPFKVVSRLSDYFNDYVAAIDNANEDYDNFDGYVGAEFRNCGVELSSNSNVTVTA
ncbi:hypothetical protein, partial [Crocosphaera watsonii]